VHVKKNWTVERSVSPGEQGVCVPARPADARSLELESAGGLATKAAANADPIHFSAQGEYWRSFFSPGCPHADPDSAPTGRFYRGSGGVRAFVRGEGRQSSGEYDVAAGVELLYSRTSSMIEWWTLLPAIQASAGAARPVESALRDSLAEGKRWFTRGELHLAWHIPLAAQFRFDINARGWMSAGLADTLATAGLDKGSFLALDLTRPVMWRVGRVAIRELFLRRVEGDVPQDWRQRRSWMLGIQSGAAR